MSLLENINGNVTKVAFVSKNPRSSFPADTHGGAGTQVVRNFNSSAEIIFDIETDFQKKVDLGTVFFEIKDRLSKGTNVTVANTAVAAIDACLSWNHCAALFTQIRVELNGRLIETCTNPAEIDTFCKKTFYNKSYFDNMGQVQNLRPRSERVTDAGLYQTKCWSWNPDCLSMLHSDVELPQNCKLTFIFTPHANYANRAVDSAVTIAGAVDGTTLKYSVLDMKMFYEVETAESAPKDDQVVLDLRPIDFQALQWNTGTGAAQREYTVKPTTYKLALAMTSSTKNADSSLYGPTEFRTGAVYGAPAAGVAPTNARAELFSSHLIRYNDEQYPSAINTQALGGVGAEEQSGFLRQYFETMVAFDRNVRQTGGLTFDQWFECPIYAYDIKKRPDDLSTRVQVELTPGADIASHDVILFSQYAKQHVIPYDSAGQPYDVMTITL